MNMVRKKEDSLKFETVVGYKFQKWFFGVRNDEQEVWVLRGLVNMVEI